MSIGVWRVGDEIQVYVTDDGPGVPIEDWESVFEPFVRVEGRGAVAGSGIGLFAARRLMTRWVAGSSSSRTATPAPGSWWRCRPADPGHAASAGGTTRVSRRAVARSRA